MTEAEPLSPRRQLLVDAAIEVVAAHGLRGLTHRAVDREAGLPEGSCSAYLRTRHAMITALGGYVASRLTADVRGLSEELAQCPGDHEGAVARTSALFLRWLDARELLVAKLELTMEATRDPGWPRSSRPGGSSWSTSSTGSSTRPGTRTAASARRPWWPRSTAC